MRYEWDLKLTLTSPNRASGEHWSVRAKRARRHFDLIHSIWVTEQPKLALPCMIKLIRYAPRPFDTDNLISSFKHLRDAIAAHLVQDFQPGHADGDERLVWVFNQMKGKPKEYKVRLILDDSPIEILNHRPKEEETQGHECDPTHNDIDANQFKMAAFRSNTPCNQPLPSHSPTGPHFGNVV